MPALREYEYIRHGTLCLFGNFHVATGQILSPMIRQTRTEVDYLENLDDLIQLDPTAGYRIIADNLTTHCSESLVRYVADSCEIDEPLGKKGVRGILKSVQSRVAFLTDPSHRITFSLHASSLLLAEPNRNLVRDTTQQGNPLDEF